MPRKKTRTSTGPEYFFKEVNGVRLKFRRFAELDFPADWTELQIYLTLLRYRHKSGKLNYYTTLKKVMHLLWPNTYAGEVKPGVLKWRDEIDMMVKAWTEYKFISLIGHASAGKTHTFAHIAVAEYICDPENTIITLTSTHLGGLKARLWSDMIHAFKSASIEIPYKVRNQDLTLRLFEFADEQKYVIQGIATDKGQDAVEKIQGNHSRNKRIVIIDEAQGTPKAIFEAAANLMADPHFRMAMLANPIDRNSEFGTWCEPTDGWERINPESDTIWETKRGGCCIRLDGLKSPNIVHDDPTLFPFLIDREYVDDVIKAYGKNSARYWAFVRGWFAPDGVQGVVFTQPTINRASAPKEFDFEPIRIASLDPAFEGGDLCMFYVAEYGRVGNNPFTLNLLNREPIKVSFEASNLEEEPLDFKIARAAQQRAAIWGVEPRHFIVDTTGAGRGVHAIMRKNWSPEVLALSFAQGCSEAPLRAGDPQTCKQMFDRFVTELWWRAREFCEADLVGGMGSDMFKTLRQDLTMRRYDVLGSGKIRIEEKRDMKKRIGRSPDDGDAFCMLVELLRRMGASPSGDSRTLRSNVAARFRDKAKKLSKISNPSRRYANNAV
jgi:hypothetical protein